MPPMSPTKADDIHFLQASIVRYRHQLDTLSLSVGPPRGQCREFR